MRRWSFAKGHGTENDFVILLDRDNLVNPTAEEVRFLCDRRAGIGGDGLLRVAYDTPEFPGQWFMDYRNADGSIAEMCGNGVRVFTLFLHEEGLVDRSEFAIGTRAGQRTVTLLPDGRIRVGMGVPTVDSEPTPVRLGERSWAAVGVDVGNPHAVCNVASVAELNLVQGPEYSAERFPEGVNVEFIERVGEHHLRMRVFERGVGETRSCGTGTVAAAAVAAHQAGGTDERPWRIDVPGGTVEIEFGADQAYLTGPAVIVARGEVLVP
ncbi:diaminopimelate epimerase [Granulicoccus phenolivorans]|uniref:diaminopimelate epimerase n=1 Tax=Granulicoccus phenolivorans TaxID=266854 RepID=UPI0003FCC0E6|nr:diaminopimelate epimerase [Granulicoccus phenolivorans]